MEKAILVGIDFRASDRMSASDSLAELAELVRSAGGKVETSIMVRRDKPHAGHFIGKGKVEELRLLCGERSPDRVIFDDDLSSTQQRNLEDALEIRVIDRTQLILDIFAQRAHSGEGKVQVELAQMEYLLPRLTGRGVILSRLGGGIGTRGPGEQKLEVDRRRIRQRISRLKGELEDLKRRRQYSRDYRRKKSLPTVALIGYTNAGKSTLINALTGSEATVEDRLFSTLDPLMKVLVLPNNQKVLLMDTVGFLSRLPHHLIDAFRATLEGVREADLLLEVLDISHPQVEEHCRAVYQVLVELEAEKKPIIYALNKTDLLDSDIPVRRFARQYTENASISALEHRGFPELLEKIAGHLSPLITEIETVIPVDRMRIVNMIYNEGEVLERDDRVDGVFLRARVPTRVKNYLTSKGYMIE